jgi:hypothetical protein
MNPRVRPAPPALPFPEERPPERTDATTEDGQRGAAWDHCPNCGERLVNDRCKYRCPRCHYFMSCSDYD